MHKRQNGVSLRETAAYFGIPDEGVIRTWERLYSAQSIEGLTPKPRGRPPMKKDKHKVSKSQTPATEHELLLAENERLRAEVAYLKKLRALVEERVARESGRKPEPSKH